MNPLTYWRVKRGMTMRELGEKCRVSPTTISRLENGQIKSQWLTLGKLANALEIEISELRELAEEGETSPKLSDREVLNQAVA